MFPDDYLDKFLLRVASCLGLFTSSVEILNDFQIQIKFRQSVYIIRT